MVGLLSFSQGESDPFYIAIVTLALTVIAGTVYTQETQYTGGDNGLFGFAYHGFSGDDVVLHLRRAARRSWRPGRSCSCAATSGS